MITKHTIRGRHPIKPLAEVAEFLDSRRRPITAADREPGPYPYYGANGQQDSVADFIFDEPLILLAEDGGLFDQPDRGIAYAISGKTWVNNHAHVLRPRCGVELRFLLRVLENYDVTPWITGSTRAKLTKAGASEIEIPLPPLAEQKRIAGILDAADALRAKRRESLAQLDSLLQSTFLTLFGDPVANPMGWEERSLGDLFVLIKNGANVLQAEADIGKWAVSRIETIWNGTIDSDRVKWTTADPSLLATHRLQLGDILFSHINSPEHIAKTAIYMGNPEILIHGINLLRMCVDRKLVDPIWMNQFLKLPTTRSHFRNRCKKSVNQASLNQTDIKTFDAYLPPLHLQRRFAAIVESVERQKARQRAHLAELDALFAALQHRAFRGEL